MTMVTEKLENKLFTSKQMNEAFNQGFDHASHLLTGKEHMGNTDAKLNF